VSALTQDGLFEHIAAVSGCNSVVECQLPKLDVAGSTPVTRSNFQVFALCQRCADCLPTMGPSPSLSLSCSTECV
jgi:hypothetical protein